MLNDGDAASLSMILKWYEIAKYEAGELTSYENIRLKIIYGNIYSRWFRDAFDEAILCTPYIMEHIDSGEKQFRHAEELLTQPTSPGRHNTGLKHHNYVFTM